MPYFLNTSGIFAYAARFRGSRFKSKPPTPSRVTVFVTAFLGSFIGLAGVALLFFWSEYFHDILDWPMLVGPLGATAVLLFAAIDSPLAQPRNCFFGHLVAAVVGVTINKVLSVLPSHELFRWFASALAVSLTILLMQLTNTLHPPAGATTLIAVCNPAIFPLGYFFVAYIVLAILILLVVALLLNNVMRRYPLWWLRPKREIVLHVDGHMDLELGHLEIGDEIDQVCHVCGKELNTARSLPAGAKTLNDAEKVPANQRSCQSREAPSSTNVSVSPNQQTLNEKFDEDVVSVGTIHQSSKQLDCRDAHGTADVVHILKKPEQSHVRNAYGIGSTENSGP
ncbi:HPP family-domain-containing protein [Endogone sp. FLAS-F59071]|nr:HPP family-domain-containing protein [Endogone sp. FLAS-F59071]|eukprot:RUS21951.1 HPP family-domain-containing protein [Endogone sp. FLAS-F59071]